MACYIPVFLFLFCHGWMPSVLCTVYLLDVSVYRIYVCSQCMYKTIDVSTYLCTWLWSGIGCGYMHYCLIYLNVLVYLITNWPPRFFLMSCFSNYLKISLFKLNLLHVRQIMYCTYSLSFSTQRRFFHKEVTISATSNIYLYLKIYISLQTLLHVRQVQFLLKNIFWFKWY